MASPGVREPHMPPVVYVQLASADVMRARVTLRAAAASYLTSDVSYTSSGEPMSLDAAAEQRLLSAASELRHVLHVHELHVKQFINNP